MKRNYTFLALSAASILAVAIPASAATVPASARPIQAQTRGWADRPMMGRPAVVGTVSAVNGTTITLSGHGHVDREASSTISSAQGAVTTFTIDASNAVVRKGNATSTVASISVGDTIIVEGTVDGTSVVAKTIMDGQLMKQPQGGAMKDFEGNGEPVVAGTVSAVSGSSFTLSNNDGASTYSVDASSAVVKKGNATSTVSAVAVGDKVVVQGTVNGQSITASTVIDQPAQASAKKPQDRIKNVFGSIGGFFRKLFRF